MKILFDDGLALRTLTFDATLREQHIAGAVPTEHTVARGIDISDHIRVERQRITAEVHVSNTPVRSPDVDDAFGSVTLLDLDFASRSFSRYATHKEAATMRTNTGAKSAAVLQFARRFDRVQTIHEALVGLRGRLVTVICSRGTFANMAIAEVSSPYDAENANATTFALELVEVRFGELRTVDAPEPTVERGNATRNRGAQPTTPANAAQETQNRSALDRIIY